MQAFADRATEKMDNTVNIDDSVLDTESSLFSAGEIIFPDENTESISTRYGYSISDLNFLVPEKMVSEVIQDPNIFNLPNSPYWIEGLINIRGNIIPVMNINKLLKKNNNTKLNNLLVLNKSDDDTAIAFLINDLPVSLQLSENKSSQTDYPDAIKDYVDTGIRQNNMDWFEFDPQKLFEKLAGKNNS